MNHYLFKLIKYTGLPFLFRELVQRNKVTILMFHNIEPGKAAKAFAFLKKKYNIISLQDYIKAVGTVKCLPKKSVIITFDDGHVGNYQLLPIIRQLQIPITIFLCSDIIGTHRHFWFSPNKEMLNECQQMKKMTNTQRLEALKRYGFEQTKEYEDIQALTREQIEEMRECVDFQSHTCFHPCLNQCDDDTAKKEIVLSKQHLERDFSFKINAISYPNGDYTPRDIHLVKEAGYSCGITVDYGFNDLNSDLLRLKRISVNDGRSMDELIVKSSGCYAFLRHILRNIR